MSSLLILIPISLLLVSLAAAFLIMAVNRGQFDDLDRQQGRLPDE